MPDDENQVRVTASGSYDNVTNFYEYIKKNDVRTEKANVMYEVGQMLDCNAAESILLIIMNHSLMNNRTKLVFVNKTHRTAK
ncbi:MAG: hypothetical protein WCF23_17565 [Candidatus Nitrosopolaris sp.]